MFLCIHFINQWNFALELIFYKTCCLYLMGKKEFNVRNFNRAVKVTFFFLVVELSSVVTFVQSESCDCGFIIEENCN